MMNADNSTAAITKAKIASTSSITFKVPSFRETYQLDGSAQAERQDALTVPVIEILYTLHSHYLAQIKPIRDVVKKTGL